MKKQKPVILSAVARRLSKLARRIAEDGRDADISIIYSEVAELAAACRKLVREDPLKRADAPEKTNVRALLDRVDTEGWA